MAEAQVIWSHEMEKVLLIKWKEMKAKKILDGQTKRNGIAHNRITKALMEKFDHLKEFEYKQVKSAVANKMKYIRIRFHKADKKIASGACRDTILRICPLYFQVQEFLTPPTQSVTIAIPSLEDPTSNRQEEEMKLKHEPMDAMDDFDWTPPTEAELKVIQAKRERNDKISKLMGDYLLKGYKMLGTTCGTCTNILMRDRQDRDYCVACSELDTEHAKDDPALSQEAAASQVQEHNHSTAAANSRDSSSNSSIRRPANQPATVSRLNSVPKATQKLPPTRPPPGNQSTSHKQGNRLHQTQVAPEIGVVVGSSVEAVVKKMAWASQELCSAHSVEASVGLCNLIKSCAEAVEALHRLTPPETVE